MEQFGPLYNKPAASINAPINSQYQRLFRDSADGLWKVKHSDGTIELFSAGIGALSGLLSFQGAADLTGNLFPTTGGRGTAGAILEGDTFVVTVGGTLCGTDVIAGDVIVAKIDTPGQACGNWIILEKAFTGGAGSQAFGRAVGTNDTVIPADGTVIFNINSYTLPNTGFGVIGNLPNASGEFTIVTAGTYEYDFLVAGEHPSAATTSLEFAIYVNGAVAAVGGPVNEFRSNQQAAATDIQVVNGHGWLNLLAGDIVTLHNRTNLVTDAVTVTSIPPGGEAGVNRTMTLKKIS